MPARTVPAGPGTAWKPNHHGAPPATDALCSGRAAEQCLHHDQPPGEARPAQREEVALAGLRTWAEEHMAEIDRADEAAAQEADAG